MTDLRTLYRHLEPALHPAGNAASFANEAWTIGYTLGYKRALESERDKQIAPDADPCPGCSAPGVCRTPACGRLKLPENHPLRKHE